MDKKELTINQVGAQLKAIRKERKMTQDEVAACIHISTSALKKHENGVTKEIPSDIIARLGEVYDCELRLLYNRE